MALRLTTWALGRLQADRRPILEMDLQYYMPNIFNIKKMIKKRTKNSIVFTKVKLIGQFRSFDLPTDWTFYKLFAVL